MDVAAVKPTIAFEDVEGSKKLVALKREDPGEIEGKQALFVVNLEPRKMAGRLSEGMLFDIGYADGVRPALAVPERELPDGARAG